VHNFFSALPDWWLQHGIICSSKPLWRGFYHKCSNSDRQCYPIWWRPGCSWNEGQYLIFSINHIILHHQCTVWRCQDSRQFCWTWRCNHYCYTHWPYYWYTIYVQCCQSVDIVIMILWIQGKVLVHYIFILVLCSWHLGSL